MRYLKLASAENPFTDYIELNDFNGFLCTSLKTLGVSRSIETLQIENRQFATKNKTQFKKYSLTVNILTKYSEYDEYYYRLIDFLDRNKLGGFRLYHRPNKDREERYCLCDIETSAKDEKWQPITLTLSQSSLWFGEDKNVVTSQIIREEDNVTSFDERNDIDGYYGMAFCEDEVFDEYYDISFYYTGLLQANFENNSYNKIPLNFKVYGKASNPKIYLYNQENDELLHMSEIIEELTENEYIEINSHINENGIWKKHINNRYEPLNITDLINLEYGSPYFYVDHGKYYVLVQDDNENACITYCIFNEEYSE